MYTAITGLFRKKKLLLLTDVFLIAASLINLFVLLTIVRQKNMVIKNNVETMSNICFDRINDLIIETEGIISDNREFFMREENSESAYVQIYTEVRSIKNNCPYVENIVFFKREDDRLITMNGTVKKEDFFSDEYAGEQNARLKSLMDGGEMPDILSTSGYQVISESLSEDKELFIVPKFYYVYNSGVLIFIDSKRFIEYSGFESSRDFEVAFYSEDGEFIFGNCPPQKLDTGRQLRENEGRINFWGDYEAVQWFKYDNMILRIRTKNLSLAIAFILVFLILLVNLAGFHIYYSRYKRLKMSGGAAADLRTALYGCMTNKELIAGNLETLRRIMDEREKKDYVLCALVFTDISDKRVIRQFKEEPLPPEFVYVNRFGSVDILFASLPRQNKNTDYEGRIKRLLSEVVGRYKDSANIGVVTSGKFTQPDELPSAYTELMGKLTWYGAEDKKTAVPPMISDKFRREAQNCLAAGDFSAFIEKCRTELEFLEKAHMPYSMVRLYASYFYFAAAEMLDDRAGFIADTYEIFSGGLSANEFSYNRTAVINVLLNIIGNVKPYMELKPENAVKMTEILEFVNKNYKSDMGMEAVAETMGMKPKLFSAFFKRHMKVGYTEYMTRLRLEHAKKLLIETDMPIKDIYEEIGYISGSTFTMIFKKYVGESPSQYRKNNRG